MSGRVVLVGAGPGDADLITLRGAEALRSADAFLYDELVARELLDLAPSEALRIDVGKRTNGIYEVTSLTPEFVLDRNGRIQEVVIGAGESAYDRLKAAVAAALEE